MIVKAANTYGGTKLAAVNDQPAANDAASFAALTFVTGACSIKAVPTIGREWNMASEDLVCDETNTDIKSSSKWKTMEFPVSVKPGDPMQDVLRELEKSLTAIGSFRITLPGEQGLFYVQAQCALFDEIAGGGKDDIITANVKLLIQAPPVKVAA